VKNSLLEIPSGHNSDPFGCGDVLGTSKIESKSSPRPRERLP